MSAWKKVFGGKERKVKFSRFSAVKKDVEGVLCGEAKNCDLSLGTIAPVLSEIAGPMGGTMDYYEDNQGIRLVMIKDRQDGNGEWFSYVGDRNVVYRFAPEIETFVGEGFSIADDAYLVRVFDENDVEEFAVCSPAGVTVYEPSARVILKGHVGDSRIAFAFHERLFVGKDYTLYYTAPADYADWGPDADGGGEIRFATEKGKITGGGIIGQQAFLTFEYGVKKLDLRGSSRDFSAKDVPIALPDKIFERSVVSTGEKLVFATRRGVYALSDKGESAELCSEGEFSPAEEPDCKCLCVGDKAYLFYTHKSGARRAFVACPKSGGGYFLEVDGLMAFSVAKNRLYYYDDGIVYRIHGGGDTDGALFQLGASSFCVKDSDFGVTGEKLFKTLKIQGKGACRVVAESARGRHSYAVNLDGGAAVCPLLKGRTFSLTFELTKGCRIDGVELTFSYRD